LIDNERVQYPEKNQQFVQYPNNKPSKTELNPIPPERPTVKNPVSINFFLSRKNTLKSHLILILRNNPVAIHIPVKPSNPIEITF